MALKAVWSGFQLHSHSAVCTSIQLVWSYMIMEAHAQDKNLDFSILYNLNPIGHQAQSDLYSLHLHLFIPNATVLINDPTTSQ